MNLTKLIENRNKAFQAAKDIQEKAKNEKRELSQEEINSINKAFAEMDSLKEQIDILERSRGYDNDMSSSTGVQAGRKQASEPQEEGTESKDYRSAFNAVLRKTKQGISGDEYRTLNIGTDAEGGYTVPDEFERTLIQALEEENIMRTLGTVITTSSGTREIPIVTDRGTAHWTGEAVKYEESNHEFGQKTLSAHKLTTLTKISEELLNDSAFNLEQYLMSQFGIRLGAKEEEAFIGGDGSGKPKGVMLDAEVGLTAGATTAITADEIIKLYHSLRRPYRSKSSFIMNDKTALAIRLLKANEQYIWQPGMQAGQPDRLLGRTVHTSDNVDEIEAGNRVMAFGDFSYYWVADRTATAIQRLNELYAENGIVGFRAYKRMDGKLILPEAVKVLKMDE